MVDLPVTSAPPAARPMAEIKSTRPAQMSALPRIIFMTRWLQVPLYIGLIVAQCVYVWQFLFELYYLVEAALGMPSAIEHIRQSVAVPGAEGIEIKSRETLTMLVVLGLIDIVMISRGVAMSAGSPVGELLQGGGV